MATRKLNKLLLIGLLGAFGLTACDDEVVAKNQHYDDPIIQNADGNTDTVVNNILSVVWDQIRDGSLASDVLDKLLFEYASTIIGRYDAYTENVSSKENEITLKDAYKAAKGEGAATNLTAFLDSHKAYWTLDENGNRKADAEGEKARLIARFESIQNKIAEAMYDKIAGGSYSKDNIFSEQKFVNNLYYNLFNVNNTGTELYEGLITPEVQKKDVFTNFLHKEYYESEDGKYDYIQKEVIPTIYSNVLTEQYILDKNYNNLGYSYARKINYVAIATNNEYPEAASKLMNVYEREYVYGSAGTHDVNDMYTLSKVWRGVEYDTTATALVGALTTDSKECEADGNTYDFLQGTAYGDLIEKYYKIKANPLATDKTVENEFNGSNKYSYAKGFEKQVNSVKLKNYVTTGWYKNDTGLPSSLENYLFNPIVASALDNDATVDRTDSAWAYDKENKYVAKINGAYYLKAQEYEYVTTEGAMPNDIVHYDASSKTYYVVQIEEAVNATKLARTENNPYAKSGKLETIINEVLNLFVKDSTYTAKAKEYYLAEMKIQYHDTVLYDYFKSNYPDLFEDD